MSKKKKRIYPPGWTVVGRLDDLAPGLVAPHPPTPLTESQEAVKWKPKCSNCGDDYYMVGSRLNARPSSKKYDIVSSPCPVCRADQLKVSLVNASGVVDMELDGKRALDVLFRVSDPYGGQVDAWKLALRITDPDDPIKWGLFVGGVIAAFFTCGVGLILCVIAVFLNERRGRCGDCRWVWKT